jgi:purine-binding chemotaxis protein CheW
MHTQPEHPDQQTAMAGKYLSFVLGKEEYGIAILRVREITGMVGITPLPRTRAHVRGVINLRGRIIPVMDLRQQFGMAPAGQSPAACIVVVEAVRDGDMMVPVGLLVDTVSEVLAVGAEQFAPPPRCAHAANGYVLGFGMLGDRVLILLDVDRVIGAIDAATIGQVA